MRIGDLLKTKGHIEIATMDEIDCVSYLEFKRKFNLDKDLGKHVYPRHFP